MEFDNQPLDITKSNSPWMSESDPLEGVPTVISKSKTGRLTHRSRLANIEAEGAISNVYQIEVARTKAIGDAMFKSGRALRFSIASSGRQVLLRTEAARRRFEPGYRQIR